MNLIELLGHAERASSIAMDLRGRNPSAYLGVVSNNEDELGKRRIKVVNPANPSLETHWIRRLSTTHKLDEPLPKVGQTVIVFCVDGVDVNAWYLPCVNDVNPPFDKASPQDDYRFDIEGKHQLNVAGTSDTTVGAAYSLEAGSITINAGGSTIAISSTGDVTITADNISINGDVVITGSASINGKDIAVVGAVDSAGHPLVTSGQ
jgi:phage baseplate assembly protein gpV